MAKHTCDKYQSFVDFWWYDNGKTKPSFTINDSCSKEDMRTCVCTGLSTRVTITVDYCPWCGEKLVRDDD